MKRQESAIMPVQLRYFFICLFALALSACGSGSGTSPGAATPASIEIAPNAVTLTQPGEQKTLTAIVLDAQGNDITASVGTLQWESTHPEQISVSSAGVIVAAGSGGSGQITARLGELRSAPLLAVHTQTPVGAVLLSDAQIVGDPEETNPDAPPSFTNTYRVSLTGVAAPQIGELLISTEGKAVAGRVVAVESNAGVHVVTLTPSSLRETFPQLSINEVIDLSRAEVIVPEAVSAEFDIVRSGTTFTFTPKIAGAELPLVLAKTVQMPGVVSKPGATVNVQAATGTIATGPLGECKFAVDGASGAGSLPISVLPSSPFSVDINPSLQTIYTSQNGLERLVLHAEPTVSAGLEFKVLVAFEGKVTCDLQLFIFRIPVGGPLSLFVGGLVPVGIGAELGGKFTFADMALGARASAKTTVDTGIVCPQGSCTMLAEAGAITTTFTPTLNGPGLANLADFRFEPSLTVYGFAKATFGSAIFSSLRFDALALKAGPALKGNFAPRSVQMADPAYKSDYQLAGIIKAGADTQFGGFLELLGLAGIAETALLDKSFPLATSPTGTVSADVASFVTGDTVNFTVKLDPASREFLGIDNVSEVLLVRNDPGQTVVARANVTAGQTEVNFAFTAPNAGSASEFFAFVVTALLPLDILTVDLEIGRATGPDVVDPEAPSVFTGSLQLTYHAEVITEGDLNQITATGFGSRVIDLTVSAQVEQHIGFSSRDKFLSKSATYSEVADSTGLSSVKSSGGCDFRDLNRSTRLFTGTSSTFDSDSAYLSLSGDTYQIGLDIIVGNMTEVGENFTGQVGFQNSPCTFPDLIATPINNELISVRYTPLFAPFAGGSGTVVVNADGSKTLSGSQPFTETVVKPGLFGLGTVTTTVTSTLTWNLRDR